MFENLRTLVIDDLTQMRLMLKSTLENLGIRTKVAVGTVKDAVAELSKGGFDLVVCDYYLGDGTDGQQLLELVRKKGLLSASTVFVMVTAERTQDRVMAAAEHYPDDYLVKPFTAGLFGKRLETLLEKKQYMKVALRHLDRGELDKAAAELARLSADRTRFWNDVMRQRGEILLRLKDLDAAEECYDTVLSVRPMPWAVLGKAKVLVQRGGQAAAEQLLTQIADAHPNFVASHDLLADVLEADGRVAEAAAVLERACKANPAVSRVRKAGALHQRSGNMEAAENAFRQVLVKGKGSFFMAPDDHCNLATVLTEQGKTEAARTVIAEARKQFAGDAAAAVIFATAEASTFIRDGNTKAATEALSLSSDDANAAPATRLEFARVCKAQGLEELAAEIVRDVVQNNHSDSEVLASAREVLGDAAASVDQFFEEVVELNNAGTALVKAGDLAGAARMLGDAAKRLPQNRVIRLNYLQALLLYANASRSIPLTRHASQELQELKAMYPQEPRLHALLDMLAKVQRAVK